MTKAANKKKQAIPNPKKRANKYDEKLTINGSFEQLVKELVTPKLPLKKK
jgi:hypothetical protein